MRSESNRQQASAEMERLWDALIAGALGDAFGYAIEFDSWTFIRGEYGIEGLENWTQDPQTGKLTCSDDTQMTLFAIEALIELSQARALGDPQARKESFKQAYLRWLETQSGRPAPIQARGLQKNEAMRARRAPGNTCLSALRSWERGIPPVNDSKGCGALMRAAPCAALGLGPRADREAAWECGQEQGQLTHLDPDGFVPGAALSWMIARLIHEGGDLESIALEAADRCERAGSASSARLMRQAIDLARQKGPLDPDEMCDRLGEGWRGDEAIAIAIWAALKGSDVYEAIKLGANHRGDSDSTAAVAAQLKAAVAGLGPIGLMAAKELDLLGAMSALKPEFVEMLIERQEREEPPEKPTAREWMGSMIDWIRAGVASRR